MLLKNLGFKETKVNVWCKQCHDGTTLVHDFRTGKRQSYGLKDGRSIDINLSIEYIKIKEHERKTLNI